MEIIKIQPTEENPIIIENYPYGFKRTLKRYWIETKKGKGQRIGEQTLNPKTQKWNKPKKSTYSDIKVLYIDENTYIINSGLYFAYDGEKELNNFLNDFENCLNNYQKEQIKIFRAIIKTRTHIKYNVVVNPSEEEKKALEEKDQKTKKELNKVFNHYIKEEGLK